MLFLRNVMMFTAGGLFTAALVMVLIDAWRILRPRKPEDAAPVEPPPIRWRRAIRLAAWAFLPLFVSKSIAVVPSGMAGVRVSQISGTRAGTLYPGVHFLWPMIEKAVNYDVRDQVFSTKADALKTQTHEGLTVGLAIAVRYRIDPRKLDYVHSNLPEGIPEQIVTPVVLSAFRETSPTYMVRELFSTKREEARQRAALQITKKLAADGIIVKEVVVRDLVLPPEFARGIEGILLKEQENERLVFEVEIKQKMVRTAELEAEADKARQIKRSEADAQTTVLRAKAEADAMQHTLPLKQKQIEQTRLEAEARKGATVMNAEAAAQAKVIDSRAELERGKLLAESDANRIRVLSAADAERLKIEAAALKDSPLLINKIIAERLSDKVQIMMVPNDGKFFFANDVLKGVPMTAQALGSGAPR